MQITIKNWRAYNPRVDVTNPSWFRLSHNLFEDCDFYDFTHSELVAWLYILSTASKKNSDTVRINFQHVERIGRIKTKDFLTAVEKLEAIQVVLVDVTPTLRLRDGQDTSANATNERTNEQDGAKSASPLDFESLYKKYPRPLGKGKGISICKTQIKTPEEFSALSLAIDRYSEYCRRNIKETKFIKHFSTFMGSWRDWLEDDAGDAKKPHGGRHPFVAIADAQKGTA